MSLKSGFPDDIYIERTEIFQNFYGYVKKVTVVLLMMRYIYFSIVYNFVRKEMNCCKKLVKSTQILKLEMTVDNKTMLGHPAIVNLSTIYILKFKY